MTTSDGALLTPPASGAPELPFVDAVAQAAAALPQNLPQDPEELFFALDIDGTLIGQNGISQRLRDTLGAAVESGAQIVIATGRGIYSTRAVVGELGLEHGWGVCSNGSLTVNWDGDHPERHRVTDLTDFDPRPTAERFLETFPSILLGVDAGAKGMLVSDSFPVGELMLQEVARDLEHVLGSRATRLVARAPWLERDDFAQQIEEMGLEDVEYAVGWTSWVDIGPGGVTKASALQKLTEKLATPAGGTIAIGDGMNDVDMLRWADHGVAMGSAIPAVKNAANAVTTAVENDGAAAVIQAVLERY